MSDSSSLDQQRINVAMVRALLEVWQASATQLSLNIDLASKIASQMNDEEERKALVLEVMKSRDSTNIALEKIKKAARLIMPDELEESEDAGN